MKDRGAVDTFTEAEAKMLVMGVILMSGLARRIESELENPREMSRMDIISSACAGFVQSYISVLASKALFECLVIMYPDLVRTSPPLVHRVFSKYLPRKPDSSLEAMPQGIEGVGDLQHPEL